MDKEGCVMDKNNDKTIRIGRYNHYKGNEYDVYCKALDRLGKEYVLYRESYGNQSFWLRPLEMFVEQVDKGGEAIPRFASSSTKQSTSNKRIHQLIKQIRNQDLLITHTESKQRYYIYEIDESLDYVLVHPANSSYHSGYLTDFELTERMGITLCRINREIQFLKHDNTVNQNEELRVGENEVDLIRKIINPCSIDLQIAESGYLTTKRKVVDPQSIDHVSSATDLWKNVKMHRSKNNTSEFFKLRPGKTVLTHTKERIRIPKDCAGKIEIKSTYARLSLAISSGDFCNPGYDGFFPLEITNNGKHTIIIHRGEIMAQLMLIPLQGPIIESYADKATHKNDKGYDDGTPYTFWRERSMKKLRKESGKERLVEIYQRILDSINSDNTDDVNEFRSRFENNFLPYCQKNASLDKYKNQDTGLPDAKLILNAYVKREKRLKNLFFMKWPSGLLAIFCALITIIPALIQESVDNNLVRLLISLWPYELCFAVVLMVVTIVLVVYSPKTFCTFEKLDLKKIYDEDRQETIEQ